jgi:hypothetical protein
MDYDGRMGWRPSSRRSPTRVLAASLATLAYATLLAGCSSTPAVDLVLDEHEYASWEVERMAEEVDLSSVDGIDASEAAEVRTDVLVELRQQGDEGEAVADLLTIGFPERTDAIPVLAERAVVDDVPSWVVVEAYGEDEGPLGHRRVWVFDAETGAVTLSASFR